MSANNRGRSTTGVASVPYYPEAPDIEAAKFLRLMAARYAAGRATHQDVREAFRHFDFEAHATRKAKP